MPAPENAPTIYFEPTIRSTPREMVEKAEKISENVPGFQAAFWLNRISMSSNTVEASTHETAIDCPPVQRVRYECLGRIGSAYLYATIISPLIHILGF